MPRKTTSFADDDVPDEVSLAVSHEGGSTISHASSVLTNGGDDDVDEIVELVRGQCLVVYPKNQREVVCAGKYRICRLKNHIALQKDEVNRSKPGWFRGAFTKKGRLIGGWKDTKMTAEEAKSIAEAQKFANRKAALQLSAGQRKTKPGIMEDHSPASTESWDTSFARAAGVPPQEACVALGKHLSNEGDTDAVPGDTLLEITETIVHQQKDAARVGKGGIFRVGDPVRLRQGQRQISATIMDIYPDVDGVYYLVADADGREIQTEAKFLQAAAECDKKPSSRSSSSTPPAVVPPATEPGPNKLNDILDAFRKTLTLMTEKDAAHKHELSQMQSKIQGLQPTASPGSDPADSTRVTATKQKAPALLFAVAYGRRPESVGVHDFATAQQEIAGRPDAVWKRVSTADEGWSFIVDYQEQKMLEVTSTPPPPTSDRVAQGDRYYAVVKGRRPGSTGIYTSWEDAAEEVEGISNACFQSFQSRSEAELFLATSGNTQASTYSPQAESAVVTPTSHHQIVDGLSSMAGTVSGPDPSQKIEGKVFSFLYTDETSLRVGLVPHASKMSPQVQMHLLGQALDVTLLPHSWAASGTEAGDSHAALSRALATMAGNQTDLDLGGEPMDLNWKMGNKVSLGSIKTLTQLRERLTELRQGKRVVEQTLVSRIGSVLQHAGYDPTVAADWAVNSILYRIGYDSQYLYTQLHEHILDRAFDDEAVCDFENAKLEIEHHTTELRRRRAMYSNRIMMVCATYAYLRDQSADNFRSSKLQEKRQKLQMKAMSQKVAQVESTYKKMQQDLAKNPPQHNGGGGRNGDKHKPMCWKCHQPGIHTGGKDNCNWKNLSDEEAKAKALAWIAAKQAQITPN